MILGVNMNAEISGIKQTLFGNLDFSAILSNPDFKEDSTRAIIIDPLLRELGFTAETIVRSKTLAHPILKTGTTKRPITLIPDYLLKVEESYAWTLDAKAPAQSVLDADNVEQVYSYATHREIRSVYFALCNGVEFSLFRTSEPGNPILYFRITEIDTYWTVLRRLLSPAGFQTGKMFEYVKPDGESEKEPFDYATRPLLKEIPIKRGAAKRHFGVHGYFTRQSWNVVSAYIKNYSQPGDIILDPFGGSGVTAIEALVNGRKAVNVDLNPMAIFIVRSLLQPVNFGMFVDSYNRVRDEYIKKEPKTNEEIKQILEKYAGPKEIVLPKGSDVGTVPELFSRKQLAQLALLKAIIKKEKDKNVRSTLMLMFSGMVTKFNLTFHASGTRSEGRGAASALMYYRYRLARKPISLEIIESLDMRFKRVLSAKEDLEHQGLLRTPKISVEQIFANVQIIKGTAADLSFLENESVDYIYTDPPYGKNIPYLDLSAMWLAWLDLDISEKDYELEAIEGGSREKSKEKYKELIAKSIQEMYRVLKFERWLSFVFAHKDPEFWHLIIDTCEKCGFEYKGAVSQKNGSSNFHKAQNPFTVLSGQLIINFRKVKNPRAVLKANLGMNVSEIVMQTIEGVIAKNDGATLEQINDELITKGLELGFLDLLKNEYSNINDILDERFGYDTASQKYIILKNSKFTTHIDVNLRIKYYLLSFLRRMELQSIAPTFSEIVLHIMPLLKNGITPEEQTILGVLEDIAIHTGNDGWILKPTERTLFSDQ
jgi:16S rRNA G966 N2-methylase RsmD